MDDTFVVDYRVGPATDPPDARGHRGEREGAWPRRPQPERVTDGNSAARRRRRRRPATDGAWPSAAAACGARPRSPMRPATSSCRDPQPIDDDHPSRTLIELGPVRIRPMPGGTAGSVKGLGRGGRSGGRPTEWQPADAPPQRPRWVRAAGAPGQGYTLTRRRPDGEDAERRRDHQDRDRQQRIEGADPVGELAEQRRPGQERRVAQGRDHADPRGGAGRVVGGGAHADREAEGRTQTPHDDAEPDHRPVPAEDDEQDAAGRGGGRDPEHRRAAVPVQQRRPGHPAAGHRGDEDGVAQDTHPVRHVVAVDDGQRQASRWPSPRPPRTRAPSARWPGCAAPATRSGRPRATPAPARPGGTPGRRRSAAAPARARRPP